jgi:hypothetical protein
MSSTVDECPAFQRQTCRGFIAIQLCLPRKCVPSISLVVCVDCATGCAAVRTAPYDRPDWVSNARPVVGPAQAEADQACDILPKMCADAAQFADRSPNTFRPEVRPSHRVRMEHASIAILGRQGGRDDAALQVHSLR